MEQYKMIPKHRKLVLILSVALIFVLSIGATLAALVQQRSVTGTISFGEALSVEITNFDVNNYDLLANRNIQTKLVPGSVITDINLKASVHQTDLEEGAEVAYVRAQFRVQFENTYANGELIDASDMIYLETSPNGTNNGEYYWKQLTFTASSGEVSSWFVLMDGNTDLPFKAKNYAVFDYVVNGKIYLSSKIPNAFGGRDIQMDFTIQAMQCYGVDAERILTGNDGDPWWDEANIF